MFGHGWEPASAKIVASRDRAVKVNGWPAQEYAVDVTPDSGAPAFRAKLDQPIFKNGFPTLGIGQVVRVHADLKHEQVKFDMSDPQLVEGGHAAQNAAFDATMDQPAGSPPPGGSS
jgi:hypothetical protein